MIEDYILVTEKQYRTNQLYVFCIIAHFQCLLKRRNVQDERQERISHCSQECNYERPNQTEHEKMTAVFFLLELHSSSLFYSGSFRN